ncbi:MAG TPA: hypothetical protein VK255_04170 [Patescibacteria group bacterium]|nr:hypothetical protein [Patescibacteria group bacterium]
MFVPVLFRKGKIIMDELPINVLEELHNAVSRGVRAAFKAKVVKKSTPKYLTSLIFVLENEPGEVDRQRIHGHIIHNLRALGCSVENTYARGIVASMKSITTSPSPSERQNGQKFVFRVVIGISFTTLSVGLEPYDGH